MRSARSRRLRPAAARMTASKSPSSRWRSLVCTLPRRDLITRSGLAWRSWACRRRLEVPTFAPAGSSSRDLYLLETNASRGSSLFVTAAMVSPFGHSAVISFREWTAISAFFSRRITSSSLMKSPLPPISTNGRSRIWSPLVVMGRSSTVSPGYCSFRRFST